MKKESTRSSDNNNNDDIEIDTDSYIDAEKSCTHDYGMWKMVKSKFTTGLYKDRPTEVYYLKCYCGSHQGFFRQFDLSKK